MKDLLSIKQNNNEKNVIILPFSISKNNLDLNLCLNVQKISAVIEESEFSLLPGVPKPFVYMIEFQGNPIPILDIETLIENCKLNFTDTKPHEKKRIFKKRIIICHVLGIKIGIIVNNTKKIQAILNVNILPPPDIWESDNQFFVSGMIQEKDHYRYLFDIEKFLLNLGIQAGTVSQKQNDNKLNLKGKSALIVEDSRVYQRLAQRFFEKYEMRIDLARDGLEGLNLLMKKGNEYDIIVSDIEMPNMSGVDMIKRYKLENKQYNVPIVFHSSISNPEYGKDLFDQGLGTLITKFNEETLFQTILEIFNNKK